MTDGQNAARDVMTTAEERDYYKAEVERLAKLLADISTLRLMLEGKQIEIDQLMKENKDLVLEYTTRTNQLDIKDARIIELAIENERLTNTLQQCADMYGAWEQMKKDANETMGWIGNFTRAVGFKSTPSPPAPSARDYRNLGVSGEMANDLAGLKHAPKPSVRLAKPGERPGEGEVVVKYDPDTDKLKEEK